jgi:tRNA pseudouridine13 synthase
MKLNELGILEYYTSSKGIKGEYKTFPEDFIVQEITPKGKICTADYSLKQRIKDLFFRHGREKYVRATLVKTDFPTMKCISRIQKELGTTVGYAGIKDKKAVTAQRVSINSKKFRKLARKNFFLKDFERCHNKIALGNLEGNAFRITIRNADAGINDFVDELESKNMFLPNFFGEQRFGVNRNTHLIGEHLVKKEYSKAAGELLRNKGFIERLFEKKLAEGRVKAFRALGNRTLSFYVHAFQSYIFNSALSEMIIEKGNEKKLVLPGTDSKLDKYIRAQLKNAGVRTKDFDLAELGFKVKGSERKAFMRVNDFRVLSKNPLKITFRLRKGSYASIILNELCK